MPPKKQSVRAAADALLARALSYPEAHEDHPWGETVAKVRKKVFLFLGADDTKMSGSVKLPESREEALALPFTAPTGYGLGKAGWVSFSFTASDDVPLDLLEEWLDESYRAIAPKRLVATLPPLPEV